MRLKHNKKRNTAFVYEALVRELTKSIVKNNKAKVNKIVPIMKTFFNNDSVLRRELDLYRSLYETRGMDKKTAERVLFESRIQYDTFDKREIFKTQSDLINQINKSVSPSVFRNFVPNYKNIASVHSIFNADITAKDRVLLENRMVSEMTASATTQEDLPEIDNLVYETFVRKFNEKYSEFLLSEQRELLNKYISSFVDGGLEFRVYLNEEISRLKAALNEAAKVEEVKSDSTLLENSQKIGDLLNSFSEIEINDEMIEDVLKIQKLTAEIISNEA